VVDIDNVKHILML